MPTGLSSRGQRAWRTAIAAVDDPVRYEQAVADYARALSRADRIRREWEAAGRPVTAMGGSTGQSLVQHPLIAAQQHAEDHVQKLATSLGLTPDGYRKTKPRVGRPKQIVPSLPSASRHRLKPVN
jgi:hypothetical protein